MSIDFAIDTEELDLTKVENRKMVIEGIGSEDNYARKNSQQKRFDVYYDKQDKYILERLYREFSQKTVQEMRKLFSINLAKRIIDEKSSVYLRPPVRNFFTLSGRELNENEQAQLEALYKANKVDMALKGANINKTRHDQCALMVVPDMKGRIKVRAIPPIHYDVVPSAHDPEKAHAVILNVWDSDLHAKARNSENERSQLDGYRSNDRHNQAIADDNDRQALANRLKVWTKDYHFTMNGKGDLMTEIQPNPIGMLPFIDVAPAEKDWQFFMRRGSSVTEFSLDFGTLLSDLANVVKLQGYAQAVCISDKVPENFVVGPTKLLHLKPDRKTEVPPSFQFVNPNPDLSGTLAFLEAIINLLLTSEGEDTGVVTPRSEGQKYTSGIDRLLSMISKFEATRDDFELFRDVENELLQLLVAWSNLFQSVTGPGELVAPLRQSFLPEDVKLDLKFAEPEATQTKREMEDSLMKQREGGYISRIDVIAGLNGVDRDKAIEIAKRIDEDERMFGDMRLNEIQES